MKKTFILFLFLGSSLTFFSQQIRTIITDSATYYVDTDVFTGNWGGAAFNGQSHVGTNTFAYSQWDGEGNTQAIVSALGAGVYPAKRCSDMVLDNQSDWYLPAGDEIKLVYNELNFLSVFADGWYWTSSDHDNTPYSSFETFDAYAWKKWFGGGEGNIYELEYKMVQNNSFCIRKETATNSIPKITADEAQLTYRLYNVLGQETEKKTNTVLLKKYSNGKVEKVFFGE